MTVYPSQSLIRLLCLCTFLCVVLSGCSGGISGTGDGDDVIIIPSGENDADIGGLPNNSADSIDLQESTGELPDLRVIDPGERFLDSTRSLDAESRSGAQDSLLLTVESRLDSVADVVRLIHREISAIDVALAEQLALCPSIGLCETLPDRLDLEIDGVISSFHSIRLERGLAGYFDNRLSYEKTSAEVTRLQWNNTDGSISIYTDTAFHTTYALYSNLPDSLTFRYVNKTNSELTQATLSSSDTGQTELEADLIDWYLRARTEGQQSVLYALNANDNMLKREAIDPQYTGVLIEACDLPNCVWQPDHVFPSDIFDGTESTIGDFSQSYLTNAPGIQPVSPVSRFVISTDSNDTSPAADSIVCGATTVQAAPRVFCWTPLPLQNNAYRLYEERIDLSNRTYRLIPAR